MIVFVNSSAFFQLILYKFCLAYCACQKQLFLFLRVDSTGLRALQFTITDICDHMERLFLSKKVIDTFQSSFVLRHFKYKSS